MDFNIKKHIEKYKKKIKKNNKEDLIKEIITNNILFIFPDEGKCVVKNNILSFENISNILQTKIKLKKNIIINECKYNNIYIRDII